jgi:hypothetical protein
LGELLHLGELLFGGVGCPFLGGVLNFFSSNSFGVFFVIKKAKPIYAVSFLVFIYTYSTIFSYEDPEGEW